jgi:hypothetical protein
MAQQLVKAMIQESQTTNDLGVGDVVLENN